MKFRVMIVQCDELTLHYHKAIIAFIEQKLSRSLKTNERGFITIRGDYLAPEMIHDTIKIATKEEIESYPNSEWRRPDPLCS